MIIQEYLKEVLFYDPGTGIFTWRASRKGTGVGDIAGCVGSQGHRQIGIDYRIYLAERLAYLYMIGRLPKKRKVVDHINRVRDDNRWTNLREVSPLINSRNRSMQSNNTSGVTGVSWYKLRKTWVSKIHIEGKRIYLGYFKDKFDAICARHKAEQEYGFIQ